MGWALGSLSAKACNSQKFRMDVSDVAVSNRPGYLIRCMTINPAEGYRITSDPIQIALSIPCLLLQSSPP